MKREMPSRQQFKQAAQSLVDRGYESLGSAMVDDAHRDGVTNFGMHFWRFRDKASFWLNYKTIDILPD